MIPRSLICLLLLIGASDALRVMTFNLWLSGREVTDGMQKIVKQIQKVDPDVVALQEVQDSFVVPNLTEMLGAGWTGVHHCNSTYPDTGVLTKHKVVPGSYAHVDYGMSVRIQMRDTGRQITFWSMHTEYHSYGPYAAYNKLVTSPDQIMAGEMPHLSVGRVQNIVELVTSEAFVKQIAKSNIVPVIVAGDFNAPSDQDWTEANKASHGGWAFEWPATKILRDAGGMVDSFRELHPDPVADPGYTWSTVNKFNKEWDYTIEEPMDRIDFIFYRGPLRPTSSHAFCGDGSLSPIPHQWGNEWPSDHYAFVTEFEDKPTSDEPAERPKPVQDEFKRKTWRDNYRISALFCTNNIFVANGTKVDEDEIIPQPPEILPLVPESVPEPRPPVGPLPPVESSPPQVPDDFRNRRRIRVTLRQKH